jgi:Stage II sporulation protein E (SpoIIE)
MMDLFVDISELAIKKHGESLCGDQIKTVRTENKTIVVLSDGLGSGVKASILATLTTEIIVRMLKADVGLTDVVETVIGTLPVCKNRKIAYSTFAVMEILHPDCTYKIVNFDSPPAMLFRQGRLMQPDRRTTRIHERDIFVSEGRLESGDFVCLLSDGILHAGLGVKMNFGWGWDNVAQHVEQRLQRQPCCAWEVTHNVLAETYSLYGGQPGDDASIVGILVRQQNRLTILTGPPLERAGETAIVDRFLRSEGRKVICGGTTGNIVARHLGEEVEVEIQTMTSEVPPVGQLARVDLLTEGIITMSKMLELLQDCDFDPAALPSDRNAAVLLAREILTADVIHFIVGQSINEFYQNPEFSKHISIRKNLVRELIFLLNQRGKDVTVEYC